MKAGTKKQGRKRAGRRKAAFRGTIALVGAGKLAGFLGPRLTQAGFRIAEIIARNRPASVKRAQKLAASVGARVIAIGSGEVTAEVLWLAVPDRMIRPVAELLGREQDLSRVRFAFHSSGALGSRELEGLKNVGVGVASAHPLMTFVPGTKPEIGGVPFAVEGDAKAVKKARSIVRAIGGESFLISVKNKPAYHAWATMTSPLLLAYLVTLERAARLAGVGRDGSRRMSLPILRQTLENYARMGAATAFTGPFIRGDLETIRKHLKLMKRNSRIRAAYLALARIALHELPVENRASMRRLIDSAE